MDSKKSGFTLIELLVVIAIISLLSSVVLASLAAAKQKAQDGAVFSALNQVKLAFDANYADLGAYPASSCGGQTTCSICNSPAFSNWPPPTMSTSVQAPTNIPFIIDLSGNAGCLVYVNDGTDPNHYELDFAMRVNGGQADVTRKNKQLQAMFPTNTNHDINYQTGPCSWYSTSVAQCILINLQ